MKSQKNVNLQEAIPDGAGFWFSVGVLALIGLLYIAYGADQLHDWFGSKNWTGPFTWDEP